MNKINQISYKVPNNNIIKKTPRVPLGSKNQINFAHG